MIDENSPLPGEEPVEVHQTEIFQDTTEEQSAQETVANEATIVKPAETTIQENAAALALADGPTLFIPPLATATDEQEIVDEHTLLMPVETSQEPGGIAMPPIQAVVPPLQPAYEPSGDMPAASAPFAGQASVDYPPSAAYTPNYTQPGYSQPLAALQPGQAGLYAPPRKRRTGLWILLIIVVIFLLGSGTALAIVASQQPTNTPTQALQQFCHGYMTSNAQEVYNILSSASQKNTSPADIQQGFDGLKVLSSSTKFTTCSVSNVQQNGSTATGNIQLTINASVGGFSLSVPVLFSMGLVLENKTWKVDSSQTHYTIPTPGLTPGLQTPTVTSS